MEDFLMETSTNSSLTFTSSEILAPDYEEFPEEMDNSSIPCNSTIDSYCGQNLTYPDGALYMKNPFEMLSPWKVNPYFTAIMITYSVTTIVGFMGNSFVVSVLHSDRRSASHNRITNVFLISLTVADLVLLLLVSPFETAHYFVLSWDKKGVICRLAHYLQMLSAASSVWNLTAISLERFIVVVLPMRSKAICTMSNCVKAVLIVWALSTAVTVPALISKTTAPYTYRNETTSVTIHYCFDNDDVDLALSFAVYFFIVVFALPAIVMIICYAIVIKHLWLSSRNMSNLINAKSLRKPERSATKATSSKTSLLTARFRARHHRRYFTPHLSRSPHSTMDETSMDPCSSVMASESSHSVHHLQVMHPSPSAPSVVISSAVINSSRSAEGPFRDYTHDQQDNTKRLQKQQAIISSSPTETSLLSSGLGGLTPAGSSSMRCTNGTLHDFGGRADGSPSAGSLNNNHEVLKATDNIRRIFKRGGKRSACNRRQSFQLPMSSSAMPLMAVNRNHHHPHRHSLISNGSAVLSVKPATSTQQRYMASRITNSGCKNNGADVRKSRNQVIKMLILIVILFCICWGPKLIWDILAKLDLYQYSPEIYKTKVTINLFPFVHACFNPIIYAFMSRNFRQAVKRRYPRVADFCGFLLHCGRRLYGGRQDSDPALGTSILPTPSSQVSRRTTIIQHQESIL